MVFPVGCRPLFNEDVSLGQIVTQTNENALLLSILVNEPYVIYIAYTLIKLWFFG